MPKKQTSELSVQPLGLTIDEIIANANSTREQYNPLRGFDIRRAVEIVEMMKRGEFAEPQWLFNYIEGIDPTLFALIECRTSAIGELDWRIGTVNPKNWPSGMSQQLVDDQAGLLRETYEQIENLDEAIEHLALASFRGFGFLQPEPGESGTIQHLGVMDCWNLVRNGLRGDWYWNPEAQSVSARNMPAAAKLDARDFIVRTVPRPINIAALPPYVRGNMGIKDWSYFIEIYGVPGAVVIGSPNVKKGDEARYTAAAKKIARGGSGFLDYGSQVVPNELPHGGAPFKEFTGDTREQTVLAGTGGMLTMLALSGTGTLAGSAHMQTFERIAKRDGRAIGQAFQRFFDKRLLREKFPGKPVGAYFELAVNDETSTTQVVEDVSKLSSAGYVTPTQQIKEKTGYDVAIKPTPVTPGLPRADDQLGDPVVNRAIFNARQRAAKVSNRESLKLLQSAGRAMAEAQAASLKPLADRLTRIEALPEPEQAAALTALQADLANADSELSKRLGDVSREAGVLADAMASGMFNGFAAGKPAPKKRARKP